MATDSFSVQIDLEGHRTSLSPAEIERELASMWKPINEAQGSAVSRVVLGNVIWFGPTARLPQTRAVLQKLIPKVPCRLFLLELDEASSAPDVEANVSAQCFLPQPGAAPVCCEVIHFRLSPASLRHVRGCVAPLLLGDLQTVLWTSTGVPQMPQPLLDLERHVDRTVRMASLCKDPAAHYAEQLRAAVPTFDLAWFRMMPLREQVTAFFDDPANLFRLDRIRSVRLLAAEREPGDVLPEVLGALFLGWIGSRLGWKPTADAASPHVFESRVGGVAVQFDRAPGTTRVGKALFREIEFEDASGERFRITFGAAGEDMDMLSGSDCRRHPHFAPLETAEALGLALNSPTRVKSFRAAAELAIPVLRRLVH